MSEQFQFKLHEEPREASIEKLTEVFPTTYFAMGIVNPMGPTLNLLASDGVRSPGSNSRMYQVMLNPFSQSCQEVGTVTIGQRWTPPVDLNPFFDLEWGCCPTFLIPSAIYDSETGEHVFAELLQHFEDGKQTLSQVRKYVGDPWKRVQGEMDSTFSKLLRKISPKGTDEASGPLDWNQALELAKIQLDPANLLEEFRAFTFAWEGSLNFTQMPGMSKDAFVRIFSCFMMTARTGFMRNLVDNPEILQEHMSQQSP
jgi:hypothetical protein